MPVAATLHTLAGARAFARFFVQTIDWGYATTSSAYMKHYFRHSCIGCRNLQTSFDTAQKRRQHFIGGRISIASARVPKAATIARPEVDLVVTATSAEVVTARDKFVTGFPAYVGYRTVMRLQWSDGRWLVVYMAVNAP